MKKRIKQMALDMLRKLLILADGRIGLNICKVLATANAAGFIFSMCCVDSDCYVQVLACMAMFGVLAAFFAMMVIMIEEGDDFFEEAMYEEDELQ